MASPQTENGFTKLATELLDAMCLLHISGNEWSYVHAVIRKTYGYNKKEDWVTNTQISKMTGMNKVRVCEAKNKLLELQIVTENRNKISLQKDYTKWGKLRKTVSTIDNITKDNKTIHTSKQSLQVITPMEPTNNANLIAELIKKFESVDPKNKNYYGNKTQRAACEFLIETYSFAVVEERIAVLPRTNQMQYFPSITTPCQLRDKWVQLENAVKRMKQVNNKVAF